MGPVVLGGKAPGRGPRVRDVQPSEHPEFFRLPPPGGGTRESRIRLDRHGRFWHDGALVEHVGLRAAFHRWLSRHPNDGRFILMNGYDWCYLAVEDAVAFVERVEVEDGAPRLVLADGHSELLRPRGLRVGAEGELRVMVRGGADEARFSRHAQVALEPWLAEGADGPGLLIGAQLHPIVGAGDG